MNCPERGAFPACCLGGLTCRAQLAGGEPPLHYRSANSIPSLFDCLACHAGTDAVLCVSEDLPAARGSARYAVESLPPSGLSRPGGLAVATAGDLATMLASVSIYPQQTERTKPEPMPHR